MKILKIEMRYASDEDSQNAGTLTKHYAGRIGGDLLLAFMIGQANITSEEKAMLVIEGFWRMTDLAIQDNHDNKQIEGITDIELWMYKLFVRVNGYMTKSSFKELWDVSALERQIKIEIPPLSIEKSVWCSNAAVDFNERE